jgi:ankyrin repeat protein
VETLTHLVASATRGHLDAQDANGDTALHVAARAGSLDACVYLLQVAMSPFSGKERDGNTGRPQFRPAGPHCEPTLTPGSGLQAWTACARRGCGVRAESERTR